MCPQVEENELMGLALKSLRAVEPMNYRYGDQLEFTLTKLNTNLVLKKSLTHI